MKGVLHNEIWKVCRAESAGRKARARRARRSTCWCILVFVLSLGGSRDCFHRFKEFCILDVRQIEDANSVAQQFAV